MEIVTKCKTIEEALFYVRKTIEEVGAEVHLLIVLKLIYINHQVMHLPICGKASCYTRKTRTGNRKRYL